jgi:predicted Fe-S protein YdhL (DUF1289 family)
LTVTQPIYSPCIDVCIVDADGLCVGCGRQLDEIARWSAMSESERYAVTTALPARIAALGPKAAAPQEALARIKSVLDGKKK